MSVIGMGVDLMRKGSIYKPYLNGDDPFLNAVFSENERREAPKQNDAHGYFENRFCCKEAVFKTLNMSGESVRFNEIEILYNDCGYPYVVLHGSVKEFAAEKGISQILVSVTGDGDYINAVALAQG